MSEDEQSDTPEYDRLIQELGDPFDRKEPYPAPEFSDLFESHEFPKITDQDMTVRMPPATEVDQSFLNVDLESFLRERQEKAPVLVNETMKQLPGLSGPNRKARRRKTKARVITAPTP